MPAPLARLRERKVFQWALAYLAAAWVLLQAVAFVAQHFGWAPFLVRGATLLLATGLLLVVILAWYHGEKGRQRLSGSEAAWISAVLATSGLLVWAYAPAGETAEEARLSGAGPTRFIVSVPDGATLPAAEPSVAISRDGSRLVYAAAHGDLTRLYLRRLDRFGAAPIPGTEGGRAPFFSPDGERVGFFADGALKVVPVRGGEPRILVPAVWTPRAEGALSGSWEADGRILLSYPGADVGSSLWEVPEGGGEPMRLTRPHWHVNHFRPQRLPGGEWILFSSWDTEGGVTRVVALSPETGEERVIAEPGSNARYLPTGNLVYRVGNDLLAAPFDAGRLERTGPAVRVAQDVLAGDYQVLQYAVSEGGTLAYVPAGVDRVERTLVWADTLGRMEPVPESPPNAYTPRLSPDGRRVIFQMRPEQDLWLLDLERGTPRRITAEGTAVFWHVWTPGGDGVVFNADLGGGEWLNLYRAGLGDGAPPERLLDLPSHQQPQSWSPDGRELVYTEIGGPETSVDIWAMRVPEEGTASADPERWPVVSSPADEFHPALSPDGRWLAYTSDASGRWEVYLTRFRGARDGAGAGQGAGAGDAVQVSTRGGSEPLWAPDGRTLYFRKPNERNIARQVLAVPVGPAPNGGVSPPALGAPRVVLEGSFFQCSQWGRSWDISPDGSRFLMVHDQRPEFTATEIDVVVHWFSELASG